MIQELLALLPETLTDRPPAVAVTATVIGAALWLAGGRFSRAILTLALVAAGAFGGLRLPRLMGWNLDGAAVGVCAALVLGAGAYFLHRACVSLLLGAIIALWAGVAVWMALAPVAASTPWAWPVFHWTSDPFDLVAQLWRSLPGDLSRAVPLACGCGLLCGVSVALLWPRVGRALLFSMIGLSIVLALGLPGAARYRPGWLALLPAATSSQVLLLAGLVAGGTLVQWVLIRLTGRKLRTQPAAEDETEPDGRRQKGRPNRAGREAAARPGGQGATNPRRRAAARPPVPEAPEDSPENSEVADAGDVSPAGSASDVTAAPPPGLRSPAGPTRPERSDPQKGPDAPAGAAPPAPVRPRTETRL